MDVNYYCPTCNERGDKVEHQIPIVGIGFFRCTNTTCEICERNDLWVSCTLCKTGRIKRIIRFHPDWKNTLRNHVTRGCRVDSNREFPHDDDVVPPYITQQPILSPEGHNMALIDDTSYMSESSDSSKESVYLVPKVDTDNEDDASDNDLETEASSDASSLAQQKKRAKELHLRLIEQSQQKLGAKHAANNNSNKRKGHASVDSSKKRGKKDTQTNSIVQTHEFQREASKYYFCTSSCNVSEIVKKAMVGDPKEKHVLAGGGHLPPEQTALFLVLVKVCWHSPKSVRKNLTVLLRQLQSFQNIIIQQLDHVLQNTPRTTTIPTTSIPRTIPPSFIPRQISGEKDLRNLIWDGKHCFYNQLPHPACQLVDGKFAYVSVIDSIAHIMCWGKLPKFDCIQEHDPARDVTKASQSKFAQTKLDPRVKYHLILNTWSDGFQCNTSKQQRFKPWIKIASLTVHNKSDDALLPVIWKTTFPVALGLEKDDKTKVEAMIYQDLKKLDSPGGMSFYCSSEKNLITVRASGMTAKGDQPERRTFTGLVAVGGSYGQQFGVIGNHILIKDKIPSCDSCLCYLIDQKQIPSHCGNCLNWDVLQENTNLNEYNVPLKQWPKDEPKQRKFQRVTFDYLKQVVNKTHTNIVEGKWNEGEAKNYLSAHAFSQDSIDKTINHAQMCIMKEQALSNQIDNAEEVKKWIKEEPERYNQWEGPPIWSSGFSMKQVIHVIMHLLFLGLTKWMLEVVGSWLATFRKKNKFHKSMNGVLETIQSMDLPWCRALPYLDGTGGAWVSENYLAFARLMPWVYSILDKVQQEETDFCPPDYDYNNRKCWKSDICKKWLELRGLEVPKKAKDRQNAVYEYHTRAKGVPEIITNEPSARKCMLVVQCFCAMVARLMTKVTNDQIINDCDCHIRIFLSYYQRFESLLSKNIDDYKPNWIVKANFLSLPGLIESMKEFGPLVLYSELGIDGEGFLKYIKKDLTTGKRKNWQTNAMLRLLRSISMSMLEMNEEIRPHLENLGVAGVKKRLNRYKVYKKVSDTNNVLLNNRPLSVVIATDGTVGVVALHVDAKVTGKKIPKVYILTCNSFHETINSLAYHRWYLELVQTPKEIEEFKVARAGILLPKLCSEGFFTSQQNHCIYAVIDEDWKMLNKENKFEYAQVESWFDEDDKTPSE